MPENVAAFEQNACVLVLPHSGKCSSIYQRLIAFMYCPGLTDAHVSSLLNEKVRQTVQYACHCGNSRRNNSHCECTPAELVQLQPHMPVLTAWAAQQVYSHRPSACFALLAAEPGQASQAVPGML